MRRTFALIRANARAFDAANGKGSAALEMAVATFLLPTLWVSAFALLIMLGE